MYIMCTRGLDEGPDPAGLAAEVSKPDESGMIQDFGLRTQDWVRNGNLDSKPGQSWVSSSVSAEIKLPGIAVVNWNEAESEPKLG